MSSSVTVSQHVAAPPERTFAVFTDLRGAVERLSGITSLDVLTDGEVGAGTRWRETRVMFGKEATEEMWITSFDPPRGYAVEADSHGSRYRTDFTFAPAGDGTDVTMTFVAEPHSFTAKLLSPLMKLMMKGSVEKALGKDMRELAEAAERD